MPECEVCIAKLTLNDFQIYSIQASQVEKSDARQYLHPAQYCASCNRGVILVLPVNTVPNIGILQDYYWRSTGAVFFDNTGETLK